MNQAKVKDLIKYLKTLPENTKIKVINEADREYIPLELKYDLQYNEGILRIG